MTERELLKRFVEWMPDLSDAAATLPMHLSWERSGDFVEEVANSYGDRKVTALDRVKLKRASEDVTWLREFWQIARAMLGYDVFGVRVLPPADWSQAAKPAPKRLQYLRGNYDLAVVGEAREETLTEAFESRALSVLGGSICYVSKKAFIWAGDCGR